LRDLRSLKKKFFAPSRLCALVSHNAFSSTKLPLAQVFFQVFGQKH